MFTIVALGDFLISRLPLSELMSCQWVRMFTSIIPTLLMNQATAHNSPVLPLSHTRDVAHEVISWLHRNYKLQPLPLPSVIISPIFRISTTTAVCYSMHEKWSYFCMKRKKFAYILFISAVQFLGLLLLFLSRVCLWGIYEASQCIVALNLWYWEIHKTY